jgi:ribonuclease J
MGLVEKQLEEFGLLNRASLRVITDNDVLNFGKMRVSFFRVTHSIPDSIGVFVETPAGNVVHTGDFKIDLSPAGGQLPPDFAKISNLSNKNVVALFSDSTNALKPGFTVSEKKIGETLDAIIKNVDGRIIIASFSSQIGRIQQIIDACVKYKRKIYLSGRSLLENTMMAAKLGYLKYPQGLIHDVRNSRKARPEETVILTTGSQGEPVSALSRMAMDEHASVKITKGDTVVLSSSPVPGNEIAVTKVINNLSRQGATIINNQIMDVHASGHAQQEDLKLMYSLIKPKYLVPIHGEYFMRKGHIEIMTSQLGMQENKGILIENGDVLLVQKGEIKVSGEKVRTNYILVDGLGMGEIGSQVMGERQQLAENGMMILVMKIDKGNKQLRELEVISRGFIYMQESQQIVKEIAENAKIGWNDFLARGGDFGMEEAKLHVRDYVDKFVHRKIERQPLIMPVIIEV